MEQHIPYMALTAIPAFVSGFVIGGYVVRRWCVMNRWRRTRNRVTAREIIDAARKGETV